MAMSPSMTVLKLEGEGEDRRIYLEGDWSLAAMPQVEEQLRGLEARLRTLPGGSRGALVCDWSRAEAAGIGPAWVLVTRLAMLGTQPLNIRHTGNPPHYLELLRRLEAERH